uniref:Secreted protein n=1 Tax=Arundo donax TaxID=35708 RepID=A0A0A9GWW4_ARUDO
MWWRITEGHTTSLLLSLLTYTYSSRLSQASRFTISNFLSTSLCYKGANHVLIYRLFGTVATVTDIATVPTYMYSSYYTRC